MQLGGVYGGLCDSHCFSIFVTSTELLHHVNKASSPEQTENHFLPWMATANDGESPKSAPVRGTANGILWPHKASGSPCRAIWPWKANVDAMGRCGKQGILCSGVGDSKNRYEYVSPVDQILLLMFPNISTRSWGS